MVYKKVKQLYDDIKSQVVPNSPHGIGIEITGLFNTVLKLVKAEFPKDPVVDGIQEADVDTPNTVLLVVLGQMLVASADSKDVVIFPVN